MKEYFLSQNNKNVLLSKESDESVVFDSFGAFVSKNTFRGGLTMCGLSSVSECKFCSISGKGSTDIDLYFDGKRKSVSGNLQSVIFRKVLNGCSSMLLSTIPFRLKGIDDVPITVLVLKKDVSFTDFVRMCGVTDSDGWVEV